MYGLSKKKMPYLHLIDEAIGLLNTEIRLIEWRIKYPEQLQQRINKQPLSPLYLADKTTLINIMEVVSGLFLSKDIVYQNGKPAYLVDLSKGFEWLFNIKISSKVTSVQLRCSAQDIPNNISIIVPARCLSIVTHFVVSELSLNRHFPHVRRIFRSPKAVQSLLRSRLPT